MCPCFSTFIIMCKRLATGNKHTVDQGCETMLRGCFALQAKDGDLPLTPPRHREKLYMVPQGIRPVVQLTAIEVNHPAPLTFSINSFHTLYRTRQDQPNPKLPAVVHFSTVTHFLPFTYLIPLCQCLNLPILVFVSVVNVFI